MPRGRKKIGVDESLPIEVTDIEEGNIPNILISDTIGIEVQDSPVQYSIVEKKIANKTSEDGTKVIQFFKWTPTHSYHQTLESVLKAILKNKRALKLRSNIKRDISDAINDIRELDTDFISAIDTDSFNAHAVRRMSNIENRYRELASQLKELEELKDKTINECNSMIDTIKEKRKIIIGDEKKRRYKLEK